MYLMITSKRYEGWCVFLSTYRFNKFVYTCEQEADDVQAHVYAF